MLKLTNSFWCWLLLFSVLKLPDTRCLLRETEMRLLLIDGRFMSLKMKLWSKQRPDCQRCKTGFQRFFTAKLSVDHFSPFAVLSSHLTMQKEGCWSSILPCITKVINLSVSQPPPPHACIRADTKGPTCDKRPGKSWTSG